MNAIDITRAALASLILLIALPLPATEATAPAAPRPGDAILVYTRTAGWRHDSIPDAVATLRELAEDAGLRIVHSEDPAMFEPATLARFKVVVFANTTGDVLAARQRAAFEDYLASGGAFMGVHSAADTGKDWPWYGDLVGAWFQNHPPGLQSAVAHFESGRGPGGRLRWNVSDELYNYTRNPRPAVDVIATVDEATYAGGRMGGDHPIAWCHARLGGRAWYTGLGHDRSLYADPVFRAHLLRGLRWTSGSADAC